LKITMGVDHERLIAAILASDPTIRASN
jgi:hypothetical protein